MLLADMSSKAQEVSTAVGKLREWLAGSGMRLLENAISALVLFVVGWLVIRVVDFVIRKGLARSNRRGLLINFVASSVTKACWAVLLVMVLGRLGVNVAPLVAGLGVTGFVLGFAFQESLGNLASGLMIALNEPFKVGDFVEIAGLQGSVVEMNIMATTLTTGDNKKIVIPNNSVWVGPIVNYSAMATRRVDVQVGIAYGEDIGRALDVIRETVLSVPGVLKTPAPTIAVGALAESQVTINVRPWAKNADYWNVYFETLKAVKDELGRAGIEIPFPQVTVHQAK